MRISENSLILDKVLQMFRGLAEQIKVSLDQIWLMKLVTLMQIQTFLPSSRKWWSY